MRLRQIAEDYTGNIKYVTPDLFFEQPGSITFIYTENNKLFWSDEESTTHLDLMTLHRQHFGISEEPDADLDDLDDLNDLDDSEHAGKWHPPDGEREFGGDVAEVLPSWVAGWDEETNEVSGSYSKRQMLEKHSLAGRVSADKKHVSFWNKPTQTHGLLNKCVEKLLHDDLIVSDSLIILFGSEQATEAFKIVKDKQNLTDTKVDPKRERELELLRNLHLMEPRAKKKAKKELGLAWSSRKNPWQNASEKAGLVQPDQKWWAPTSESKE